MHQLTSPKELSEKTCWCFSGYPCNAGEVNQKQRPCEARQAARPSTTMNAQSRDKPVQLAALDDDSDSDVEMLDKENPTGYASSLGVCARSLRLTYLSNRFFGTLGQLGASSTAQSHQVLCEPFAPEKA